jgi:hypothetical protein
MGFLIRGRVYGRGLNRRRWIDTPKGQNTTLKGLRIEGHDGWGYGQTF